MNDKKEYYKELFSVILGELIVSLLTVAGFFVADLIFDGIFDYTVVTGALLGAFVVILNFLILSVSINRVVDSYVTERGGREMTEEEAEAFALEHEGRIKLAVSRSYIIRTLLMIGTLVCAFLLEWFHPLAAAIPLFMYKPVIYLTQLIRSRKGGTE